MNPATFDMLLKKAVPAADGKPALLRFCVMSLPRPTPEADEVVVRVGAAPVNPSDLGGMLWGGDRLDEAYAWTNEAGLACLDVPLPDHIQIGEESEWSGMGNEGAGIVEDAGSNAKHLLGKTVFLQGAMYAQLAKRNMSEVQVQPEGVTVKQAASSFVNPMTVLGMLEKMRREGHAGIVHTAAASQLGQMLVRVCSAEGVLLVNIVRRPGQVELLKRLGASHVVDSSAGSFREDLIRALAETGATLAFDALGGGPVASAVLECMEHAAWFRGDKGSTYGSSVWKQLYTYGRLDSSPPELSLNYGGFRWNIGGYLVSDFLETVSEEWRASAKARIARELSSTFRTEYGKEVSLRGLLTPENMKLANMKGTGNKLLIVP